MTVGICTGERQHREPRRWRGEPEAGERGATLFLMIVSLVVLLGVSAFAIDLGLHYVVRSEAQRAADAGALAGAKTFVDSGYLSGAITQSEAEDLARQTAITVASQNLVGGQLASVLPADVSFDFSNPENPLITVVVARDTGHGNPMPTLFARALGITQANISAVATAEAFTPAGGNIPVGTSCLKPWILPNCDPTHAAASGSPEENPNCPGVSYYVDPNNDGEVLNPGSVADGGVVGSFFILKPGLPSASPAPGQFYPIQLPPGPDPALCPGCAQAAGGSEGPGGALYRYNIACCNTARFVCGQQVEVDEQTGNMVGPTNQGVACLIHQTRNNCGGSPETCGQDYIPNAPNDPFNIVGGTNNPITALRGVAPISSSDSIVTIPMYEGYPLSPGESGALPTVTIVGFLQVFVRKVGPPQSTVDSYVMNVAGCGPGSTGGSGGGPPGGGVITSPAGLPFPVRLVRPGS